MTIQSLTNKEQTLLQRHFDGELQGDDESSAKKLLAEKPAARAFLASLEELALAVRESESLVWESASVSSSAEIVELAVKSSSLSESSLSELAPLLERFFDGEADEIEAIFVADLIDERADVAAYLEQLDELRSGLRDIGAEFGGSVDFGDFWSGIDARLDEVSEKSAGDAYQADEHAVLLYRYHDQQVDDAERGRVEGWLVAGNQEVSQTIAALDELHLAVNASVELAQERVDLSAIWSGVEEKLDTLEEKEVASSPAENNVVSLSQARAAHQESGRQEWVRPAMAFAAAVTLLLMGGLLAERILGSETVIIKERTVVIVDSVEHGPGVRVDINSPIEQAGHEGEGDEDFPTVIWLLDADDDVTGSGAKPGQPGGPI